ncbi:MAG: hypothetical protein ACKPGJ_11410, partial [Dolichospermum sp.]
RTRKEDITKLLQVRFGDIPQSLLENINQIDDTSFLEQLLLSPIRVSALEYVALRVNSNLAAAD